MDNTNTHSDDTTADPFIEQFETAIKETAHGLRSGKEPRELASILHYGLSRLLHSDSTIDAMTLASLADGYWKQIAEWASAAPTGVAPLDRLLGGGLLPGRLVALLGAPGAGKSSLACQISETVASAGRPVLYLTSEDSPHMMLCRSMARLYGLSYGDLLRGYVKRESFSNAAIALAERPSASRMLIVEQRGPFSLDAIAETARAHFVTYDKGNTGGPGLLVIDYLQRLARANVGTAGQDLRLAVTALCERLRDVARDLGCTVMVLSAQGRDAYKSGTGSSALASGKESGDLEYTADALMAIMPSDDKDQKAPIASPGHATRMLRVDKNRQGETGVVYLDWLGMRQMFSEVQG